MRPLPDPRERARVQLKGGPGYPSVSDRVSAAVSGNIRVYPGLRIFGADDSGLALWTVLRPPKARRYIPMTLLIIVPHPVRVRPKPAPTVKLKQRGRVKPVATWPLQRGREQPVPRSTLAALLRSQRPR
jgi:hypothetical protein